MASHTVAMEELKRVQMEIRILSCELSEVSTVKPGRSTFARRGSGKGDGGGVFFRADPLALRKQKEEELVALQAEQKQLTASVAAGK